MTKIQEDAWIMEHETLARHTHRLRLKSPGIAALAKAGQFLMLRVSDGLDPLLRRPFSLHRIFPEKGIVEVLYRMAGRGTWRLSQSSIGAKVNLVGPLGNSFALPADGSSPVVLVAGGIGVAPLFALMDALFADLPGAAIHLFYGARTAAELLPEQALGDFKIKIYWSTDDGTAGHCGRVTDLFRESVADGLPRPSMVYSCGPLAMQYHVAKWTSSQGLAAQLSLESFMACGLGACLGCALPAVRKDDPTADHYVHVCKDGPIFSPGSIQWQKIQMHRPPPPTFLFS